MLAAILQGRPFTHTVSHIKLVYRHSEGATEVGKYDPLGAFLRSQGSALVPMTFEEIEEVTGVKLPPKAQHHRAWWSNNASNNVMTKVWLDAGYETEQVDMTARKLVFRRIEGFAEGERAPLTPPEAQVENRHPLFGILKDVTILVPGVDLTEPACLEWSDKALEWVEAPFKDK